MAKVKIFLTRQVPEYGEVVLDLSKEDEEYLKNESKPFWVRNRRLNKIYKEARKKGLIITWETENNFFDEHPYFYEIKKENTNE